MWMRTPGHHAGIDDTFANLDPCLHGVGPDHLNPFHGDEDPLDLESDPDVTQDGSESGLLSPALVATKHKENSQDAND